MTGRFQDKVVIVTGSSNGIGRAAAQLFAEQGAKVTITGRSKEALDETKRLLLSAGSSEDRIVEVIGDLTNESVQKSLIEKTVEKFGHIDVLVNNAGGTAPDFTQVQGLDQDLSCFDYVMDLNVKSVIALTKLSLPYLQKTKGNIVMVSSISALCRSWSTVPYYAASKSALDQITRSMATSYIEYGIRVNSVNPGPVDTTILEKQGITSEMIKDMAPYISNNKLMFPMGRQGQPKEIAEAIVFLADSNTSSFIVGHCLVVDGGTSITNPMSQNPFDDDADKKN